MINKVALLVFGLLALTSIGCKNQIEDKKTDQLDSIINLLVEQKANLEALDQSKISKMSEVYDGYLSFFQTEFDSIENAMEILPLIDKLGGCAKKVNKVQGNFSVWRHELEESIEKFKALRHDYSNKLISKEELSIYLTQEVMANAELERGFKKHFEGVNDCVTSFKTLTDKLDSIRVAHIMANE